VLTVWEHFVLLWQVRPSAVDYVDARQTALLRDGLHAHLFFARDWVVRAPLDGRVVRDDGGETSVHESKSRDECGGRYAFVVSREHANFQERRSGVEQACDAVSRGKFRAGDMFVVVLARASQGCKVRGLQEVLHARLHVFAVRLESIARGEGCGGEQGEVRG